MLDNRLTITGKHLFYDYEKITVTNGVAIGLTASKLVTERKPISVFITVEDNQIRWRADGINPPPPEGHLSNPSASFTLEGIGILSNIKFIATGSDAVLRVSYRR